LLVLAAASPLALAADHLDAPGTMADPTADITDTYAWLDGSNVVLILNVTPLAMTGAKFSDKVQYVLHTESSAKFGMPGTKKDIICTFDAAQKISCWLGGSPTKAADDYVTGDAGATAGLMSTSGKVKVFAGLRDDPFFFNLDGFKDAVAAVDGAEASLTFDPSGCPAINGVTATALGKMLGGTMMGTMPPKDFFGGKNVLSIVLSIDKSLLNTGGPILNVWGSTNKGA
jgi:hypothetical protein